MQAKAACKSRMMDEFCYERKRGFMRRFLSLLLTVMLALSLCIMVFADTESYEDERIQETQAVVEVEETENEEPTPEDDGIQVCGTECGNCGKMSMSLSCNLSGYLRLLWLRV